MPDLALGEVESDDMAQGRRDPVKIDGVLVDAAALHGLAHDCRPELCNHGRFCCSQYVIHVTPAELERIVGFMPLAARYARGLKTNGGFRNVFEEEDDGTFQLDSKPDGTCLFSHRDRDGRGLCSLHSAALDLGRDPARVKPECCTLWPLALAEGRPSLLGVHEDAYDFPCNHRRQARTGRLNRGVRNIVLSLWDAEFLRRLEEACAELVGK
ncbi:MAG: hypothetical protein AB1896_21245 [Thermodesulfobacteriota bacterium]